MIDNNINITGWLVQELTYLMSCNPSDIFFSSAEILISSKNEKKVFFSSITYSKKDYLKILTTKYT